MSTSITRPEIQVAFSDSPKLIFVKVSGIGRDRVGVIYKCAKLMRRHRGNILFHRSTQFAGEFAFTMIASFSEDNPKGPASVLDGFADNPFGDDFVVFARVFQPKTQMLPGAPTGTKYFITVTGPDRLGIVESISLVLMRAGLNLNATESEVSHRPFSGTPVFVCVFELVIPDDYETSFLFAELEEIERNTELTILVRSE